MDFGISERCEFQHFGKDYSIGCIELMDEIFNVKPREVSAAWDNYRHAGTGIRWSAYQYDEEREKINVLLDNQKNVAVANFYNFILLFISNTTIGNAGSPTANLNVPTGTGYFQLQSSGVSIASTGTANYMTYINNLGNTSQFGGQLYVYAGTDTTTATTAGLGALVSPVSTGASAGSVSLLTSPSTSNSKIEISFTYAANAFGTSGTTTVGELGMCTGTTEQTVATYPILLSRLAVADADDAFPSNTAITVNNTIAFSGNITLTF